jgi:hypothetical protein
MVRIATRTARTASKGNGMVGDYDRLRRRGHIISLSHKAVPLYSELPRRLILGNWASGTDYSRKSGRKN